MGDYLQLVAQNAAAILSEHGDRGLVLAAQLGLLPETIIPELTEPAAEFPGQIGVWRPVERDGKTWYVRLESSSHHEDRLRRWADVSAIPPKGARRRIVLLGESVARGVFLDPDYTPAGVLQVMLSPHYPQGVEVVDLAATSLRMGELVHLMEQVPRLEPDALVIFAGNNWVGLPLSVIANSPARRQVAVAALEKDGVQGLRTLLEEELLEVVAQSLGALRSLAEASNLPVVFLMPEFNLLDWEEASTCPAPFLPGDDNRTWWRLHAEAERRMNAAEFESAARVARDMVALDGGTTSRGLKILGRCLARLGELEEARAFLERARDSRLWDPFLLAPRCHAAIREGLRRLAGSTLTVVDLPSVFRTWSDGSLPDRRLFLDYCHLSVEGIRVAMAAAAQALLANGVECAQLLARGENAARPEPAIEGIAHVLAAIHNAHVGQEDGGVIRHHLARAAALSPRTVEVMDLYLEILGRGCIPSMTAAAQTLQTAPERILRQRPLKRVTPLLDERLLDAMVEQLAHAGVDRRARLAAIRAAEWSVAPGRPIELISEEHRPSVTDRSWPILDISDWSAGRGWYRAYAPTSSFSLSLARAASVALTIVSRSARFFLPDGSGGCQVELNGAVVGEFFLREEWRVHQVHVASGATRSGLNELRLRWPTGTWDSGEALAWSARELEAGRIPDLTPAFADMATLRVALAEPS